MNRACIILENFLLIYITFVIQRRTSSSSSSSRWNRWIRIINYHNIIFNFFLCSKILIICNHRQTFTKLLKLFLVISRIHSFSIRFIWIFWIGFSKRKLATILIYNQKCKIKYKQKYHGFLLSTITIFWI